MDIIKNLIENYGAIASLIITMVLWYWFIFAEKPRSIIKLLAFPAFHFRELLDIREHPSTFPIVLCYVTILGFIGGVSFPQSFYIFLAQWGLILTYEVFGVTSYIFRLRKISWFLIIIGIMLIIVSYGSIRTIQLRDNQFQLMNTIDFIESCYIFIGAIYIIVSIIVKERFWEDLESFFVFFSLIIYSFSHLLSTSPLALDFVEGYAYTLYSTIIAMFFWSVSVPWIRHLRAKHS
jgi:hypothetical protein